MEKADDDMLPHTHGELLQASIELTHHTLGYVKSMALGCAVRLGVADAIRRSGGDVSLDRLLAALSLSPSKLPYLRRVMRVLTSSGVFAQSADGGGYRLTPVSILLLSDGGGGGKSLRQLVHLQLSPFCVAPVTNLAEWFTRDEETPFSMTYGTDHWGFCSRDAAFNELFNGAMECDSRFIMDAVISEVGHVLFDGVTSMVDVAGGTGGAAKAVAAAYPHIKCMVLDLPHVIDGIPAGSGLVEFVAGDMMDFIPEADALLLKFVLHDWSDEDCVNILKRCKDAIHCREPRGKVIIIDVVVGSSSQVVCHGTQLLFDLLISTLTPGKERDEQEWCKLFEEAGFSDYKIRSMLGLRSVIEDFP